MGLTKTREEAFREWQAGLRARGKPRCKICSMYHDNTQLFKCHNCHKTLCEGQILPDSSIKAFVHFETVNLDDILHSGVVPERLVAQCGPVHAIR